MGNFEKKYVNAAFVAAFVILVVVNIVTYVNARIHLSGQNTINETFNEIQRSEVFLSSFSDAEANMRGYLITSRVNILEQFYSSMKSTDSLYYKPKNEVNASSSKYDGFSLEINDEKILPGIDTAIPCGLIVNDLLVCMMKYSFDGIERNCLERDIFKAGEAIKITIKDNGKGIAPLPTSYQLIPLENS